MRILLGGFFVYGWWASDIAVHIGGDASARSTSTSFDTKSLQIASIPSVGSGWISSLQTITGELMIGPNPKLWSTRSTYMAENTYIYGRLYDLTDKHAIGRLQKYAIGHDVGLILEDHKMQQFGDVWQDHARRFAGTRLQLLTDKPMKVNYTHAKTFVGDKRTSILSANLTHASLTKNQEEYFYTANAGIRDSLYTLYMIDSQQTAVPSLGYISHPNLLICPIDCRAKITALFASAQQSIIIRGQYIHDSQIQKLLLAKKKAGVRVRITINDDPDNYPTQDAFGRDVVTLQKKPYIHSKYFVIDDRYTYIGSMNLSTNAMDNNREIGIILLLPIKGG